MIWDHSAAQIDDDGGQEENADPASATPDPTPAGTTHTAPPSNLAKPTTRGYGLSSSSESEADDEELKDAEEDKIADGPLEADTRRTLGQSRSEAHRLSNATPKRRLTGGGGPPPDSPSGLNDGGSGAGRWGGGGFWTS
ncbi:hypothetical protein PC123_g17319 [Phytophthora cactorum]|nr:hypothetical protein PC123_g17319 [Phytophthora cactorum]